MKNQAESQLATSFSAFSSHNADNVNYSQRDLPRLFVILKIGFNKKLEPVFCSSSYTRVSSMCKVFNSALPSPAFVVHRYDPFIYSIGCSK